MPAHKASAVQLSAEHERELTDLVRAHSTPQKLAERARIVLLAEAGLGIEETAQQLGIWRKTAGHWRRRWRDAAPSAGVAARLSDAPRCGAPARFTPEVLMANHGVVTYGEDLCRAYMRMEAVEHYAKIVMTTRQLGTARSLDSRELEKLFEVRSQYVKNGH